MGCAIETQKPKRRRESVPEARPYSELSEEAKKRARDWWRGQGNSFDDWDAKDLTDCFAEELLEKYGIEVDTCTEKLCNGKTHQRPHIFWSLGYSQSDDLEFKAGVDVEELAKKDKGIRDIMQSLMLLEAAAGWESSLEWSASMDKHGACVACYPTHDNLNDDEERVTYELFQALEEELGRLYKTARHHLMEIGYAEVECRDSDEYIAETLEGNDHILFDEEGDMA